MAKIIRHKWLMRSLASAVVTSLIMSTMLLIPLSAGALSASMGRTGVGELGADQYLLGEWVTLTGSVDLVAGWQAVDSVVLTLDGPDAADEMDDVTLSLEEGTETLLGGSLIVTVAYTNATYGQSGYAYGEGFLAEAGGGSIDYTIQWRPPYELTSHDAVLPDLDLAWEIPSTPGVPDLSKKPLGMTAAEIVGVPYLYLLLDGGPGNVDIIVQSTLSGDRVDYYAAPSSKCTAIAYMDGSLYVYADDYQVQYPVTETPEPDMDNYFRLPTAYNTWDYQVVQGSLVVTSDDVEVQTSNLDAWNGTFSIARDPFWDDAMVAGPSVLKVDSTYHMWYYSETTGGEEIGHATSPDRNVWTKDAASVLTGTSGEWDEGGVLNPTVWHDGTNYHMWYIGHDAASTKGYVGYAISPDGADWTKNGANPVLSPGGAGEWDNADIQDTSVLYNGDDSIWEMWYFARGGFGSNKVGYASSTDGAAWTKLASVTTEVYVAVEDQTDMAWSYDSEDYAYIQGDDLWVYDYGTTTHHNITGSWTLNELQVNRFEEWNTPPFDFYSDHGWSDDNNSSFSNRSNDWVRRTGNWGQFGNSTVTINFSGTDATLGYYAYPEGGNWSVTLDAAPQTAIDAYDNSYTKQTVDYTGLADAAHTLILTQVNTPGGGGGYDLAIDYLDVGTPASYPSDVAEDPDWHPTDPTIAFSTNLTGTWQVFEVDVTDPSTPVFNRVTQEGNNSRWPSWDPGGTMIAYSQQNGNYQIYGIEDDGGWGAPWEIYNDWQGSEHPAWSPSGDVIAWDRYDGQSYDIIVGQVNDQTGQRPGGDQNNSMFNATQNTWDDDEIEPAWNSDGSKLAVQSDYSGDFEIWAMDFNSQTPSSSWDSARQLTFDADEDQQPDWRPDNAAIGFASDRNGNYDLFQVTDSLSNPIFTGTGDWDEQNGIFDPTVVRVDADDYRMWYAGANDWQEQRKTIRYAESDDGKMWEGQWESVINWNNNQQWENQHAYGPTVIWDSDLATYVMWYVGENWEGDTAIGMAALQTGNWDRDINNPSLQPGAPLGVLSATYLYSNQNDMSGNSIIKVDPDDSGAYVSHFNTPGDNMGWGNVRLGGLLGVEGEGESPDVLYGRGRDNGDVYVMEIQGGSQSMWINGDPMTGMGSHHLGGSAMTLEMTSLSLYYAQDDMIYELVGDQYNPGALMEEESYDTGIDSIQGMVFVGDTLYVAAGNVGQVYTTGLEGQVDTSASGEYEASLDVTSVNNGDTSSTPITFSMAPLTTPVAITIDTPTEGQVVADPAITITGTVNDPSIDTVEVGIALPLQIFLNDDMENGDSNTGTGSFDKDPAPQDGWTNYSPDNLWHITDQYSMSGGYSWGYFHQGGWGYNTGQANSGAIVSVPFDFAAQGASSENDTVLSFETSWDTDGWVDVDRKLIDIYNTTTGEWEPLAYIAEGDWYYDPFNGERELLVIPMGWQAKDDGSWNPQQGQPWSWYNAEINLSDAYPDGLDDAQIRFRFDTMDDWGNDFQGWFVDDVSVTGTGFIGVMADVVDGAYSAPYTLSDGYNDITVSAQSAYLVGPDASDTQTVSVALDNSDPFVELDPVDSTQAGIVTVTGSVYELEFAELVVTRNGSIIQTITGPNPPDSQEPPYWDFSVDIPLQEGNNEVVATVTDQSARVGSDTIDIIRDSTAPVVTVLDTIYYLGEVSGRRDDLIIWQVDAEDPGTTPSGVESVEIRMGGGEEGNDGWMRMIPADMLPEAFIDSWGATGGYVLPMIIPDDASPGDYDVEVRATDNAANSAAGGSVRGTVVSTLSAYNIYLMPNWNFFSLPLIPDTADIETLMGGIVGLESVQYYDAASQTWQVYTPDGNPLNDDLLILETGKGYWALMDEDEWSSDGSTEYSMSAPFGPGNPETPAPVKFSFEGQVLEPGTVPPTYDVYEGWNAVGIHSEWAKPVDTYLLPVSVPQQSWAAVLQYDNYISVDTELLLGQMYGNDNGGNGGGGDQVSPYEIYLGSFRTLLETNEMSPADGFWLYLTEPGKLVAMP